MKKSCVNNIIPFSAVDGVGNRMIVFFQGCNFDCLYCHNPETIPFYSVEDYEEGFVVTADDILEKVKGQMPFIRGVTISGGECTASFDFLLETVQRLKEENIHILIDTNGFVSEDKIEALAPFVDGFMLDIKAIDPLQHKELTGVTNELVLKAFDKMHALGKLVEVRTVVLGNIVDSEETVKAVSEMIVNLGGDIPYKLIAFRKHGIPEKGHILQVPSTEMMTALKNKALSIGVKTVITL
jgi:pyruvate-formate lyase-activating enzyme